MNMNDEIDVKNKLMSMNKYFLVLLKWRNFKKLDVKK